ncbi:uncharacterized protein LOC121858469 [Homarus americanus]|uniref:uncharacterized protein LOC121858469 n=1 Tax=Homarus americanus TaxID=6706 RepID=UPI001C45E919|nr:uncharacterized protein LOC121858469 [Homarus americanus]
MPGGGMVEVWVVMGVLWAVLTPALATNNTRIYKKVSSNVQITSDILASYSLPGTTSSARVPCASRCNTQHGCQAFNLGHNLPHECHLLNLIFPETRVLAQPFDLYVSTDVTTTITNDQYQTWGYWRSWTMCDDGSFIHKWKVKSEEYANSTMATDHVGVSIIQVTCIYPGGAPASVLTQGVTDFIPAGTWSVLECPGGTWMKGFTQAVTPTLGGGDDDALANMRLYCSQDSAGSGVAKPRLPAGTAALVTSVMPGGGMVEVWVVMGVLWAVLTPALATNNTRIYKKVSSNVQITSDILASYSLPGTTSSARVPCASRCNTQHGCQAFNLGHNLPHECHLLNLIFPETRVLAQPFDLYVSTDVTTTITNDQYQKWGSWRSWTMCDDGSFIHKWKVKSEEYVTPTADKDHVGVSIIQVTCIYPGGAPASVLTQGVTDFIPAGTWSGK